MDWNPSGAGSSVDPEAGDPSGPKTVRRSEEDWSEEFVEAAEEASEETIDNRQEESDGTGEASDLAEEESIQTGDMKTLKKVQEEMSKFSAYPVRIEVLQDSIRDSSVDPNQLLRFFKIYNHQRMKYDKGSKRSKGSEAAAHKESGSYLPNFLCVTKVKIFAHVTGLTYGAHDAILEKLHSKWSTLQVERTEYRQESDIIIIFCPVTSRVGADVEAAMRKVTDDKPAILVVMHHTRDEDYSTDLKRWSAHYSNVRLDVHVLFHETLRGLLDCSRNDQAVQQIKSLLKRWR